MLTVPRTLMAGVVIGAGDQVIAVVPLDNAERARLRFEAVDAGTLKFRFMRPNMADEYALGNPADAAVLAATEEIVDLDPLFGEAALKIIYNTAGGTTVTFADWSGVSHQ